MEIRGEIKDGVLFIEITGRLNGDNAENAEKLLREERAGEGYERTVFDLKGLEYISSAGLRIFMKLYREDKKLQFINASPAVYDTFDLTGFTDLLEIRRVEEISSSGEEDPLNDTFWPVEFKPVSYLFEEQARKHPDRTAVVGDGLSMTYGELNEAANRIANALRYYNVRPNDTIMILLPRNIMYYAVNLGILKAGAAFVTASINYPDERIRFIYQDAACRFLITTHRITFDKLDLIIDLGKRPLFLEDIVTSPWPENPQVRIDESDLAYCIYTSGSTGKPKGVMITQGNLCNYLDHNPKNRQTVAIAEHGSVLLANAALTFDVSLKEELIGLTSGMTVALASYAQIMNPFLMRDFMIENGVDAMCATPSYVRTLLSIPKLKEALSRIKVFAIGAEQFPQGLYEKIREINESALVMNSYGPTETTISACMKEIDGSFPITIGRPLGNVACYVVNEANEEVKLGEIGELLICGKGVGLGYKNLPEKTAASFIDFHGKRAYKTGDFARITDNYEIEFHGRRDNQVKYHGLRIELGEIEEIMSGCPYIDACAAVVVEDRFLCLYYVSADGMCFTGDDLRDYAKKHLAPYMMPDLFQEVEAFSMNANMKLDRKKLPKPVIPKKEIVPAQNETQERILSILRGLAPDTELGITTDLRDLGLTSLSFMAFLAELGDAFRIGLNMAELRENPTVSDLEKLILKKPKTGAEAFDKDRYPMVPLQLFMYDEMLRMNNPENVLLALFEMAGDIDILRLRQAVQKAVKNHPILFTRLQKGEGRAAFMLPAKGKVTLPAIPVMEVREEEMPALRGRLALELADPQAYPLFEFRIYKTEKRLFLFHKVPHAISDGESLDILFSDIADAYAGKTIKPEGISLFGICDELNRLIESPLYAQIVSYYKRLLRGLERWTAVPEDQTGMSVGQDRVVKTLGADTGQIAVAKKALKVSGNVLYMGLMALSMARQTGDGEITFAFTHNGRNDSRVKRTYGFLLNEGVCRLDVSPSQALTAFFSQVQNQVFDAMSCQLLPFEEIAEWYPGFMDYGYLYQPRHLETEMNGEKAVLHSLSIRDDCEEGLVVQEAANEDMKSSAACEDGLFKILTQVYEFDPVVYELTYMVSRYSRKRIEEMAEDVDRMLLRIVTGDAAHLTVGDVCIKNSLERNAKSSV